jgi:hypothetical protein
VSFRIQRKRTALSFGEFPATYTLTRAFFSRARYVIYSSTQVECCFINVDGARVKCLIFFQSKNEVFTEGNFFTLSSLPESEAF